MSFGLALTTSRAHERAIRAPIGPTLYIYKYVLEHQCRTLSMGSTRHPPAEHFTNSMPLDQGEPIDKFGDGSAIREFTYVSDIVNGIILAIDQPNGYRLMNLGGGTTHTLNEFIATIEKHVGKPALLNQLPDQPGDVAITSASQEHAFAEVGFKPKISLDEGIARTVEWYRNCDYVANF